MEQEDTFEIAAEEAGNQREDVTARRFDRLSLFWQQEG
jgi:hypothetical protein